MSAGTSVTSSQYSSVYSSRLSLKDSQTVPAVMVEPSFSLISTPPGNSAGCFGRPIGLDLAPFSLPSPVQYAS